MSGTLGERDNDTTLRQWILQNGGNIHKGLALCTPQSLDDSKRGIFSLSKIKKGDVLIRLPDKCALNGKDLPARYEDKNASPWLRCLASLLQEWHLRSYHSSESMNSYVDSLPNTYESLLNWEMWELRSFLAGTALSSFVLPELEAGDKQYAQKISSHCHAVSTASETESWIICTSRQDRGSWFETRHKTTKNK